MFIWWLENLTCLEISFLHSQLHLVSFIKHNNIVTCIIGICNIFFSFQWSAPSIVVVSSALASDRGRWNYFYHSHSLCSVKGDGVHPRHHIGGGGASGQPRLPQRAAGQLRVQPRAPPAPSAQRLAVGGLRRRHGIWVQVGVTVTLVALITT